MNAILLSKSYSMKTTTFVQIFCLFYKKKIYFFLFYTSIFIKHSHQFIYSTHLFNKIFIFLIFLLFSHSWPLSLSLSLSQTQPPSSSPNHHQVETQIFQTQTLWSFRFSFSWLIEVETQTHSSRNPTLIGAKVYQTHSSQSWRRRRGPTESEWEKKRLIKPIEAGWKEEANEEVDQTHWSREWMRSEREGKKKQRQEREKMRTTETNRDKREREKINKIIINELQ